MDNKTESLKAKGYDLMAQIEWHQTEIMKIKQSLQTVGSEIIKLQNETKNIPKGELPNKE